MFQSITIKSKDSGGFNIDIGFLAECLLFYGKVNFLADKNTLPELLRFCGIEELKEMLKSDRLNLYVRENFLGVSRFPGKHEETYDFQTFSSDSVTIEKRLYESLVSIGSDPVEARKQTDEFLLLAKPFRHADGIIDEIKSDLNDKAYLSKAILSNIKYWNPEVVLQESEISAEYIEVGSFGPFKSHRFVTNIDLAKYNNVSPTGIILNIAEARGDIQIAGTFNSEIADKPIYTSLIQARVNSLIDKFEKSQKGISSFQEVVLSEYRPVGNTIQSKAKDFKDFLPILEKAEKFRDWLEKVDTEKNIVAEYYKAVTSKTWLEKLPAKSARFAIFTGAGIGLDVLLTGGLLGTGAGIVLGLGDNFLVDKLAKGWKPNQFVDDSLKPFLPEKK